MVSAEGAMICIVLNVKTCFKMSTILQRDFHLKSELTYEGHMKTH